MSFLYFKDLKFIAYDTKLTLCKDSKTSIIYINNDTLNDALVRYRGNNFSVSAIEGFFLSEDDDKMLAQVNELITNSNKNKYLSKLEEIENFILYRAVSPSTTLSDLKKLSSKYIEESSKKLRKEYTEILTTIRKQKEYGGYETNLGIVDTDAISQSKISSLYQASTVDGLLTNATPFKLKDGSFITLDIPDIRELYTLVAKFIQICFAAETNSINRITNLTYDELNNNFENREEYVNNLFKEEVSKMEKAYA